MRESPAFPIIRKLKAQGARLTAYDPIARPADHEDLVDVKLAGSLLDAVADAQDRRASHAVGRICKIEQTYWLH